MDVSAVDYYANHGRSFLHRASAPSKLVFAALVIASVVITGNFYLLLAIYAALATLAIWTGLPALRVISIAAYPAIFAVLFAAAAWNGDWTAAGVIVLKALGASLAMVLLIVTTPYPDVFSSISPFLPKIIVEGLFLTYRSLFVLLGLMDSLIKALRVRGGLTHGRPVKNIVNFSSGIGLLIVRGLDMSEKLYGVMNIRGYDGRLSGGYTREKDAACDTAVIAAGALVLAVSLAGRINTGFGAYAAYILCASAAALICSALYFLIPHREGRAWKRS